MAAWIDFFVAGAEQDGPPAIEAVVELVGELVAEGGLTPAWHVVAGEQVDPTLPLATVNNAISSIASGEGTEGLADALREAPWGEDPVALVFEAGMSWKERGATVRADVVLCALPSPVVIEPGAAADRPDRTPLRTAFYVCLTGKGCPDALRGLAYEQVLTRHLGALRALPTYS